MTTIDQCFVHLTHAIQRAFPAGWAFAVSTAIKVGAICTAAPLIMMYLTWLERKIIARMQNRIGPNRVGTYGLLQPVADGLKMLTKEDIVPRGADRLGHTLAPLLAVVPALMLFAIVPFGRNMIAADLNVALLYFLAVGSVGTFAVFIGGWASRSKFSLLGAMRSVAQLISYEVPMLLSVVVVVMVTGSLSVTRIVEAQSGWRWFIWTPWGLVGFGLFFIAALAEVNRTPFDLPEAESELVGGFHTEYSGMKFALFYMGEFLAAFINSAMAVTLFLGGWQGPWLPSWAWFILKTYALLFVMIWLRGTFPRLRVDQLMGLAWKFLLPLALVNILAAGCWIYWPLRWALPGSALLLIAAYALLVRINAPSPPTPRTYHYA